MNLRAQAPAFLLLWACATASGHAEPTPERSQLRLVDLTDEFDALWERDAALAVAERVTRFKVEFGKLLPGFVDARRVRVESARYDLHIAQALASYPKQREAIRAVSRRFTEAFGPAMQRFESLFGPVTLTRPAYLINSLGEMDGGLRSLPGGRALIFGADMIAHYHREHSLRPLIHHELFHVVHLRRFRNCSDLWCTLWIEGLATYASSRLNPGATDAELLLDIPGPIRGAANRNRREAVCNILARLSSRRAADRRAIFGFEPMNERLPARFGYYVGYLVAAEAAKKRTLQQLARLPADKVRPLIVQGLRALETCP